MRLNNNLKKIGFVTIISALLISFSLYSPPIANGRGLFTIGVPGVRGGVVTTSEPIAAQVGGEILRKGGNAVDAAAAVAFALNVIEPQSSGIGGGGFMIFYDSKKRKTTVVDSRERAPENASPDMFLDSGGEPFAFGIRSTSGIGVGVPGMVRGIALSLDKWGTMSLGEVLEPAIKLAADGFRVSSRLEDSIAEGIDDDGRLSNEIGDPAYDLARSIFAPGGNPLEQNDLLIQPDLAKTFQMIADEGPDVFYTGDIARAIVKTQLNARSVADMELLRGRMTLKDLADYKVSLRKPVVGEYRGFKIVSMPPPSSGGLTIIQILKLIERFPIGKESKGFGFGSTRTLNVMLEAMRLAFADRAVWMGDTDFVDLPVNGLIDDDYLATRTVLIDPDARQASVEAGDPRPFDMSTHKRKKRLARAYLSDEEGLNTTHFTIIDRKGNIVTYTNTIESAWGTGLIVPEYGFFLNNELTDFNRVPAFSDEPQNFNPGANDAAPFKRPRSSMSPTLIFKGNKPVAAYGSPGGSTIINSVVNVTLNLIDHRRNIQEVIDAPRISQTSANGSPTWEAGFSQEVIDELQEPPYGHNLADSRLRVIGSVQAVVIGKILKLQYGAADRRRIGSVVSIRLDELMHYYGDRHHDGD